MNVYRIECECDAREVYYVQADSEDEARQMWQEGKVDQPSVSEITGSSISSIEVADD